MKLDDRFMAILTILLLAIGGGAVLQSGSGSIFGTSGAYEARPDAFTLRAGRIQSLDVLLNDLNPDRVNPDEMQVTTAPTCGMAMIVNGAIQYSETETCSGTIELAYCVPFDFSCDSAKVTLTLLQNEDLSRPVAAANADGSPVIVDVIQMGAAPQTPGGVVAARPARLSMPTESEVITPSAATAEVRRIGEESNRTMVAAAGSDSAVRVNNTSARSGRVATAGVSMAAPDPVGESSGISIASGSGDSSPRGTSPTAPGGLSVAGLSPTSPGATFTRPTRPDGGGALARATVSSDSPGGLSAPAPAEGTSVDVAIAAPTETAPKAEQQAPVSTGQEVAIAPEAQISEPATPADLPTAEAATETEIAALPAAPEAERNTPGVGEPSAASSAVEVETADTARPSTPGTPDGPARLGANRNATAVASLSEGDAGPRPAAATPEQPTEKQRIARAPDAQVAQPSGPSAPAEAADDSGVMASLARSNTVIGTAFSAAKALFGPSETTPTVAADPAGESAPKPVGTDEAPILAAAPDAVPGSEDLVVTADARVNREGREQSLEVAALDSGDETYVPRTKPAESPLDAFLRESGGTLVDDGSAATAADPAPAGADPVEETVVAALPGGSAEAAGAVVDPVAPGGVRLALPTIATGDGAALCDIRIGLQVQVGAEMIATVYSECRPETAFLVEHEGLVFTAFTDIDGVANFVVPALASDAEVTVTFPDGGQASDRALVEGMSRMTRVAVVWTDAVDFDLHAREFGADAGSDGDIWAGNARNYRLARRSGGGYLMPLGPTDGTGVRAEVYTLFESLRTQEGVIDFDLTLAPGSAECAGEPVIRVVRSEATSIVNNRDIGLDAAACGTASLSDVGFGLQDIRIARSQ